MALFNHRAKTKERQYNKGTLLEVVHRKPGYNVYYFSVGANCSVRCRGLIRSYIYLTPNKTTRDHLIYLNINQFCKKLLMKSLRHVLKRLRFMKSHRCKKLHGDWRNNNHKDFFSVI